jgi:CHAT domain-containing protein
VSSNISDRLIGAESAASFLREAGGALEWSLFSSLKSELDLLLRTDINRAEALAGRIEELAALGADSLSTAFADASRARLLHHLGQYGEADSLYMRAAAAMRDGKLFNEAAVIQMHRVFTLTEMGRYDEALQTSRLARRSLRRGEPLYLAQLEANTGNVYYRLDRYKKALDHYDRARAIFQAEGEEVFRAVVEMSRANVFTELDRADEALALANEVASVSERAGWSLYAAQVRFQIAYLQFLRGNYNTALTSYYNARDRVTELGGHLQAAWCNQEIAEVLLALNSFDDASESATLARSRFIELGLEYEAAQAAMVRALAAMGLDQHEEAQVDLIEARGVFESKGMMALRSLADLYLAELALRRGDLDEATRRAEMAGSVFKRQRLLTRSAYSQLIAARAAYLKGESGRASRMARSALKSVEDLFAPAVSYRCHHLIGSIERDRGRRPAALESFRRAVETIEQLRGGIAADEFKATFLRDKIEVYEDAIAACLSEGDEARLEDAFRLVESSKSRALADLLARYLRSAPKQIGRTKTEGAEAETRARLLKLIEDLNWYSSHAGLEDDKGDQRRARVIERHRREVRRCERQIAQLFRRLESEGSAFVEMQRLQPVSLGELQGALEPGETVIEYFTTGDSVSAFVASRDSIKLARDIASRSEIEQMLASLRFQIEKFNYGPGYVEAYFGQLKHAADAYLSKLYEAVFAPLEPLVGSDRLSIIPHGALHYVPFHALRRGQIYLVDDFEISYAPSAAVLKLCRARSNGALKERSPRADGRRLVALGVTHHDTPSIEEEIRALGSIFSDSVTLTGAEATRENLLKFAPRARFLHLASHGYFRRDNPMFSFLKLADSPLNFYSLLDLELEAEMVTLSACHTGVNMVFPGDELHGLMRGFLYAGAPSLVASLWAVSDRSTSELMREMYSRISAGETKRAALRAAQLLVKEQYGHPYYWAPFILMGNPL